MKKTDRIRKKKQRRGRMKPKRSSRKLRPTMKSQRRKKQRSRNKRKKLLKWKAKKKKKHLRKENLNRLRKKKNMTRPLNRWSVLVTPVITWKLHLELQLQQECLLILGSHQRSLKWRQIWLLNYATRCQKIFRWNS